MTRKRFAPLAFLVAIAFAAPLAMLGCPPQDARPVRSAVPCGR